MRKKRKYGILGQLGHLYFMAHTKKEAVTQFSKDFDITKYPVKLIK